MAATDNDVLSTTSKAAFQWGARLAAVKRQRDDLLAACKAMLPYLDELLDMPHSDSPYYEVYEQAEVAIAAVKGDQ